MESGRTGGLPVTGRPVPARRPPSLAGSRAWSYHPRDASRAGSRSAVRWRGTRTERQLNATEFGRYFALALSGEDSDLDKDERVSLLEAFLYSRQEVERHYEEENEMLTETAVLDDNGDFELSHDAGLAGPDGPLAATFHLGGVSGTSGQVPDDPELARLYEERAAIQGRIDEVRALRESMSEDQYLDALEPLLVELALKNREIRAIEEGGA